MRKVKIWPIPKMWILSLVEIWMQILRIYSTINIDWLNNKYRFVYKKSLKLRVWIRGLFGRFSLYRVFISGYLFPLVQEI